MTTPIRLLTLCGSARAGSFNRKLLDAASERARQAGHAVQDCDLRALALPVYDGDLEARDGVPDGARTLREALRGCDAVLIASPEYNGFPPPLLINAMDWMSRLQAEGDAPAGLACTANKPVALLAASPGPLGGLRAMNTLRAYLQMAFAMIVVPQQFALGRAGEAFDEAGALKDAKTAGIVDGVVGAVATLAGAVKR